MNLFLNPYGAHLNVDINLLFLYTFYPHPSILFQIFICVGRSCCTNCSSRYWVQIYWLLVSTRLTVVIVLFYPSRTASSSSSRLYVRIQCTFKGNALFNICSLKATLFESEHANFYLLYFHFITESQKPLLVPLICLGLLDCISLKNWTSLYCRAFFPYSKWFDGLQFCFIRFYSQTFAHPHVIGTGTQSSNS